MAYETIKRVIDVISAILLLILFSPIMLTFAVLIFLQDFHTPIYIPIRVGKNKKKFKFYKFRTMVKGAEKMVRKDPELYKHMRSGSNKMEDDPRVTQVGKFVRKYSIDEFPQLFNVLKGDMSLVGPRALMPDEYDEYSQRSLKNIKRLKLMSTIKPGITGYWQVSGRSGIDFDTRMDMDCYYADNLSLKFDLLIMFKTPLAILKAEGAY